MTRIGLINTDKLNVKIRVNPSNLCHLCNILVALYKTPTARRKCGIANAVLLAALLKLPCVAQCANLPF